MDDSTRWKELFLWYKFLNQDPFGLRREGGGVEGSRVEFAENIQILGEIYSTPPSSSSI